MKNFSLLIIIFAFISILTVSASESKKKIYIKNVIYVGNERIGNSAIKFYTKIEPNTYISKDDIDLTVKNLYKTGLFKNINAFIKDEENLLIINVQENPLINRVILKGNKLFSNKELFNIIQSKPLTIFSKTKLESDLLNIVSVYRNNGKISSKISYQIKKFDHGKVDLIIEIIEGKTHKIKEVKFIGNKSFSEKELKRVINIEYSNNLLNHLFKKIFKNENYYSPQFLSLNEEIIKNFYSSRGYVNSNIQALAEINNENNNEILITFLIDEGEQYLFGKSQIDIESKTNQDENLKREISKLIDNRKTNNKIFDKVIITDTLEKINNYLSENGYLFTKVNLEYIEKDNNTIDVVYKILLGKKVYINQIIIDGNNHTFDEVIRNKISLVEGDLYNGLEVKNSYENLINSNLFEKVKVNNHPINDRMVNLNFHVKEKNTNSLYLGGGVSIPGGIFLKTDFRENNLFGSGKKVYFNLNKNRNTSSFRLELTENNFNDLNSLLGVGIFYNKQDNKLNTNFNRYDIGFFTKLSYKITENLMNSLNYTYKYNLIHYSDNKNLKNRDNNSLKEIVEVEQNQNVDSSSNDSNNSSSRYHISSIGYALTYNKLDNTYSPIYGYLLSLSQDIAGLGGNFNFIKSEFLSFYTHPIMKSFYDNIILRFKMTAGHIFSYTDKPLNISQHFFKGGNEIRGFDLYGIGPRAKDKSSLGGKTYLGLVQQVDFPLLPPQLYNSVAIKGSVFIDYYTLFGLDDKKFQKNNKNLFYDSKLIRVSPGIGFSIPSPFGGRFRLDFAFPLVKEDYDIIPLSNVRFSIDSGI